MQERNVSVKQSEIEFPGDRLAQLAAGLLQAAGYEIVHMGGGTTAWRRSFGDWYVLITDEDGASHERSGTHWLVGVYYREEGEERHSFMLHDTMAAIDAAAGAARRLEDTRQAAEQFSPSEPEVRKMLTITTAHVSLEATGWLAIEGMKAAKGDPHDPPVIHMASTMHGWIFYCHGEDDKFTGLPADVTAIMKKARSLGCDYVMLDGDAETIEGLPVYDW